MMAHTLQTPLGDMLLACDAQGLTGAWFVGQKHMPDTRPWQTSTCKEGASTDNHLAQALLERAQAAFEAYFAHAQAIDLPLSPTIGTPFQREVWAALRRIPWGQTSSYGELASWIGRPTAARAVGAAVGRNPWSVVVPCHRVLGAHGALTGYASGLERKVALLQLEGAQLALTPP